MDLIDILISVLMISGLFAAIKVIGYGIERFLKRNNAKLTIGSVELDVLNDTPEQLYVGGKRLTQSQMLQVISAQKATHNQIVFFEGTTQFSTKYAIYTDGTITYNTGKTVTIE